MTDLLASRIAFGLMTWEPVAEGARQKVIEIAGQRTRLLELTDAFVEEDWCTKGHVGYVLQGEVEIRFETSVARFAQGETFTIASGAAAQHKARSRTARTLVLLVEDA